MSRGIGSRPVQENRRFCTVEAEVKKPKANGHKAAFYNNPIFPVHMRGGSDRGNTFTHLA